MNRLKYLFPATCLLLALSAGWSFGQAKAAPKAAAPAASAKVVSVDLNSANKKDLMGVPGLSESAADLIISHRPYKEKDDLKNNKVISDDTFAKIAPHVFVKSSGAAEKAAPAAAAKPKAAAKKK